MGHIVRCKAQNDQIKEILAQSKGKNVVITIDYMMKYEETRARESSREHYGKRGIIVHGALLKYQLANGSAFKRIYVMSPEGDGAQDSKSALVNVDGIYKALNEEIQIE